MSLQAAVGGALCLPPIENIRAACEQAVEEALAKLQGSASAAQQRPANIKLALVFSPCWCFSGR